MTVERVEGRRGLSRFVDVPWHVYDRERHPNWIPPLRIVVKGMLDTRKDPFWDHAERALFVARRDGRLVGRIAAVENRAHNERHGDRLGFFGFFESVDDPAVANALLDAAAGWLRSRGLTEMRGPVSPSTNHETGLLVRGFRWEPTFLTPWTPRYYPALLEGWGLEAEKDLLAYFLPTDPARLRLPDSVERAAERARERTGTTFRDVDLGRGWSRDMEVCRRLYNEAWDGNWGFVPMEADEFHHMADELKPLLLPEFNFIAEVDGEPAGFLVVVPDFNQVFKRIPSGRLFPTGLLKLVLGKRRLRTGRVILLGVRRRYRGSRAIFPLFAHELMRRGRAYGALGAEASWVLEDNEALNGPLRALGAKVTKRWRVYRRSLESEGRPAEKGTRGG